MRRTPTYFLAVAAASALAVTTATPATAGTPADTRALRQAVTVEGVTQHLKALQDIADANGGTRASGTSGYDASVAYVTDVLTDAGYSVREQMFDYEFFSQDGPTVLDPTAPDLPAYTDGTDVLVMEYSGDGDVEAPVQAVDLVLPPGPAANTSTSGCEAGDFAGFTAGNIALLQRGTCTFRAKAENAAAAGAAGAIIFNEGQEGRADLLNGTLSAPQVTIPVVGTTFAVGDQLATLAGQAGGLTARLATDVSVVTTTTSNVIADSTWGRTDRVVMAGAHLDSVPEGPGINDNGSGSAAILETAVQLAAQGPTENAVRFALWGAEESGLIGSQRYVDSLSPREVKNLSLYLNFDMVGSPNFVRFVYDGDGSAFGVSGPNGSAHIEKTFTSFFTSQGLASEPTQFDGRSDYDAFISAGVPAGGLFTGAEGIKTPEQAAVYGGTAGDAYDPCYHQACDTIDNLSDTALEQMSDAVAHAVLTYADTESAVNGTAKGKAKGTYDPIRIGAHMAK